MPRTIVISLLCATPAFIDAEKLGQFGSLTSEEKQAVFAKSPALEREVVDEMLKRGKTLGDIPCDGMRFPRAWRELGGLRVSPYVCQFGDDRWLRVRTKVVVTGKGGKVYPRSPRSDAKGELGPGNRPDLDMVGQEPGRAVIQSGRCELVDRMTAPRWRRLERGHVRLPRRAFLHLAAGAAAVPVASRLARAQSYRIDTCGWSYRFRRAARPIRLPACLPTGCPKCGASRWWPRTKAARAATSRPRRSPKSAPDGYTLPGIGVPRHKSLSLFDDELRPDRRFGTDHPV